MTTAKKPSKTAADLRAYELGIINGAVNWTAFVQVRPGDRRRHDAASQEAAIVAGADLARETDRRVAMIYATDSAGRDTLAGTVDQAGVFTSAVTPA
jgi:hypothetical protein